MADNFDPKAYLAKKEEEKLAGFDPKAYLASKQKPDKQKQIDDALAEFKASNDKLLAGHNPEKAIPATLRGAAEGLTFGTYPYLVAGVEKALQTAVPGYSSDIPGKEGASYDDLVQAYREKSKQSAKDEPVSYYGSQLAGGVGSGAALSSALKAAPVVGNALTALSEGGKAAQLLGTGLEGAAMGAAYTPDSGFGDIQGRLNQAGTGFGAGVLIPGVLQAGSSLAKSVGGKLEKVSNSAALKQSGFMLKDLRETNNRGITDEVAQYIRSAKTPSGNKLLQVGDTAEDIAKKAAEIKQVAGNKIGDIYDQVGNSNIVLKSIQDPVELISDLNNVAKSIEVKGGKQKFNDAIDSYLSDMASEGNNLKDIRNLNDWIGDLDSHINYSKQNKEIPVIQQGYKALRSELRKKVNNIVDEFAANTSPELGAELRQANKDYGLSTRINKVAGDKSTREEANRFLGLTEQLGGGLGAGLSALTGNISHAPESYLAGVLASKGVKKFGAGAVSNGAGMGADLLKQLSQKSGLSTDKLMLYAANPAIIHNITNLTSGPVELDKQTLIGLSQDINQSPVLSNTEKAKIKNKINLSGTIDSGALRKILTGEDAPLIPQQENQFPFMDVLRQGSGVLRPEFQ